MRRLISLALVAAVVSAAATLAAEERPRLVSVELEGRLLEPKEQLLRFLGLVPGAPFDDRTQQQIGDDLDRLGYRLVEQRVSVVPGGVNVHLHIEPVRVVRHVAIHGNWPLFEDEVLRHLTLYSGRPLPPDEELRARLEDEERHILELLQREGYFGGTVKITPLQGPQKESVDLDVRIDLGQWYPLGSVRAEGNRAISNDELFSLFNHCCFRFGRFGVARMREDAHKAETLLRERGYPAARVLPRFDFTLDVDKKGERVNLPVKVVEKRRVDVHFQGNHSLTDRELKDQLTIYSTGAYDDVELAESARALHRYYQQHGFFEARVNFTRRREGDELERITFAVEEGPELKVRRVDFVGESGAQLTFTDDDLKNRASLETKVFPALGLIGLGEGGYVTTLQLSQDVDRLREFYKSQGFPEAKIRGEVARDPNAFDAIGALGAEVAGEVGLRDDLFVRFFVEEGRRELVDHVEIDFTGPHLKTKEQILSALKLTDGQPYTDAAFLADQSRILTLYRSLGRPYVQIGYAGNRWNKAHDRITLSYRIDEGAPTVFGEILIRGNFKTRGRVILADLPFKPGDAFDYNKLAEGERNLQTHGIFNSARVTPVRLSEHPAAVPILVTVQERWMERFGSLAVGAGLATDRLPYYYYVSLGWVWNNFFGLGSQTELRADFDSPDSWSANLRYTDLRAFGPGWRFDLNGFWRQEVTYAFGPIRTVGGSLGLTRSLTPTLRLFGRFDVRQYSLGVGFVRVDGPHDFPTVIDQTLTIKGTLGLIWDRRIGSDGLPNALMPAKGWLLSASLGYAIPVEHTFLVAAAQAMALTPVKVRGVEFTLIANLRFDEGWALGGESSLPLVERFYAGGDTTTRGYETDQLKTEIVPGTVAPLAGQPGFRIIPQGGNLRVLSTLELQFPIAKSFLGLPWVGAIFYDVGAVSDSPNQLRASDFKHAIGITVLRVLTPFGPLSLEYAYPLTPGLAEERWKTNPWYSHFPGRIHFNWGIPLSRL